MQKITLFIVLLMCSFGAQAQKYNCKIVGTVIDRPYEKEMILTTSEGDPRIEQIVIPIVDGKFEYVLQYDEIMEYCLSFESELSQGSWRTIPFFPAKNGTLKMTIQRKDMKDEDKITIKGDPELKHREHYNNEVIFAYNARYKKVIPPQRRYNEKGDALMKQIRNEKDFDKVVKLREQMKDMKQFFSDEYLAYMEQINNIREEQIEHELKYLKTNINYFTLSVMFSRFTNNYFEDLHSLYAPYCQLFEQSYAKKYPNHSYTKKSREGILGKNIIVGESKFIDFEAPDLSGKIHRISELIAGKVAILDLWASWCGQCRVKSIEMIPLYEKYKNQGFTVVGVARESARKDMEKAVARDGYPWINLLELKDIGGIWNKYNVANRGGRVFIIDRDGTILAIDPTFEELEKIISEKLR